MPDHEKIKAEKEMRRKKKEKEGQENEGTFSLYAREFLLCAPSTPLSLAVRAFESRCPRVNTLPCPPGEREDETWKFAEKLFLW